MAERNHGARGGRGRAGRGRGREPEAEDRPNLRDERDLEIAAKNRRIRELERQLAAASLNIEDDEDAASDTASTTDGDTEDTNPFGVLNQREASRLRFDRKSSNQNFGMKLEIPEFEGRAQADDFIDWLHTIERIFDLKDLTEEQKVKVVAIKLKKHASIWWEHLKTQRKREGKSKIATWEKMKKLMRHKFLPAHYRQESFIDYHNIRQRDMTVEQYIHEFDRLRMRCDVAEEDEQTVARFLAGLKTEISDVVQLQQYWSYEDVCRLSLKVEAQYKRKGNGSRFQSRFTNSESVRKVESININPTTSTAKSASSEPAPTTEQSNGRGKAGATTKRCYKCQGLGHIAVDCPNRHFVTLVEDNTEPIYDDEKEGVEQRESGEEDIIYADSGESLIVRRVLSATITDEESWLRSNIFHTKCTSGGKVCSVIIDGGSCENVVSTNMVDKLGLKTESHPQPYKLSWLKKGSDIKVTKKCLVSFSIGKKYVDEVWCDVIPMDACHLLLGRPWQFDRKSVHDGFKNTYTFTKDGQTITLGSIDIRKEMKNNLLSISEVQEAVTGATEVFALVGMEPNEDQTTIPSEVQPLLKEFQEVILEELPPGLPPMQDIQHCVNFNSGVVIPNKPAYHFSSDADEHAKHIKKVHSQVQNQINKQNKKYKQKADKHRRQVVFKPGDLIWIHLRREHFPAGRFGKLQPWADGPFKILEKINDNTYKINLPGDYNVSGTFNVADLSPYYGERIEDRPTSNDELDSRTNLFLEGEYDAKLAATNE